MKIQFTFLPTVSILLSIVRVFVAKSIVYVLGAKNTESTVTIN